MPPSARRTAAPDSVGTNRDLYKHHPLFSLLHSPSVEWGRPGRLQLVGIHCRRRTSIVLFHCSCANRVGVKKDAGRTWLDSRLWKVQGVASSVASDHSSRHAASPGNICVYAGLSNKKKKRGARLDSWGKVCTYVATRLYYS